ncbi:MAG TPA: Lrp/AsnC family transcriptional regulator [Clostridia bacterium]|nr:Lrp/AsnC family transcriptional regulator [Clostridia bacterium]
MTELERAVLNEVQTNLPIAKEPFKELGQKFGLSEAEVLEMLKRFKEAGYIRRMGAIFDSRKLGYVSTLCAAKVSEDQMDQVAEYINGLVEVTHNYLREHEYNMWFTVIAHSKERIEEIIREMESRFGVEVLNLPAKRFFKIKVNFDFLGGSA